MVITLCGQKGGAGKTTVTTNVIAELLARGLQVLLVDIDGQGSARTWADKAARQGLPAPTIAVVDGIPFGPDDAYDEVAIARWLKRDLPAVLDRFDYVVIDCPGKIAGPMLQTAALGVTDVAVIPAQEDAFSAWSLAATARMIRQAQHDRPQLLAFGMVTRTDKRRLISQQAREHIAGAGLHALKSEMGDRAEYVEAPGFLLGVSTYKPRSLAAAEVRGLVNELVTVWRRHAKAIATDVKCRAEGTARADLSGRDLKRAEKRPALEHAPRGEAGADEAPRLLRPHRDRA